MAKTKIKMRLKIEIHKSEFGSFPGVTKLCLMSHTAELLESVFPRKSLLVWNYSLQLFQALRQTGNHWHTIGFPVSGLIYALPEEAIFMVEAGQAAYSFNGLDFSEDLEALKSHLLEIQIILPGNLSAYLSLKHLGYIVYKPSNPYLTSLDSIDQSAAWIVFKPNSSFQKKNPTGLLGCIRCTSADMDFRANLADFIAVHDGSSQIFLRIEKLADLANLQ